ncbi:MAG TPA: hypothetical protein PKA41_15210 [Verrucomicrobiota bacterium]|nr:hypothetical protein [Verrucomicrobiota bacterium]
MGINSYITHRMFVAALDHEETPADAPVKRQKNETAAEKSAATNSADPRFSALAQAEAVARRWRATAVTTLL